MNTVLILYNQNFKNSIGKPDPIIKEVIEQINYKYKQLKINYKLELKCIDDFLFSLPNDFFSSITGNNLNSLPENLVSSIMKGNKKKIIEEIQIPISYEELIMKKISNIDELKKIEENRDNENEYKYLVKFNIFESYKNITDRLDYLIYKRHKRIYNLKHCELQKKERRTIEEKFKLKLKEINENNNYNLTIDSIDSFCENLALNGKYQEIFKLINQINSQDGNFLFKKIVNIIDRSKIYTNCIKNKEERKIEFDRINWMLENSNEPPHRRAVGYQLR
jgi:hypothetical protein